MSLWDMVRGRGQAATPRHAPTVDAGLPLSFGPAGGRPLAQSVVPGEGLLITTPAELEAALRGESSGSGEIVTHDTALRVGGVFGCVRMIAGKVSTLPLDVKRRLDDRSRFEAFDSAVWTLMRRKPTAW